MLREAWAKCQDCHHEQYMFDEDTTCAWCGGKLKLLNKDKGKYERNRINPYW